ncbi:hypothetical protein REPUB_Repub11eG0189500 [Reevesia pubescens]
MASASLLKTSPVVDKFEWVKGQTLRQPSVSVKTIASLGRGILAMDESNATRQAYRTLLVSAPGLGQYISGVILFEETLYQSTTDGKKMVDVLFEQNIVPGIKVDKGLVPLVGSNNESWCQGLDGLALRSATYYQQGARFAKWRTVGTCCEGSSLGTCLLRCHLSEILLDGEHGIDRTFEVARKVWAEVFFYLAQNNVMFEVLSGGQSEVEATLNLNAMRKAPNPWHVSFSYARALQNTCLKKWGGRPENVKEAQDALLVRAKANSLAQLGKYTGEVESEEA